MLGRLRGILLLTLLVKFPELDLARGEYYHVFPAMASEPKVDSKLALYVGLALQAAGIVWWASSLNSEVQHNDFQIQMMAKDVEKHAIFVRDWPSGKYGSGELPSDTRQDLHITELQRHLEKLMAELYTLKTTKD